jgi:hypothetical protein
MKQKRRNEEQARRPVAENEKQYENQDSPINQSRSIGIAANRSLVENSPSTWVIPSDEASARIGWAKALDPSSRKYSYYKLDGSATVWENPLQTNEVGQTQLVANDAEDLEDFSKSMGKPQSSSVHSSSSAHLELDKESAATPEVEVGQTQLVANDVAEMEDPSHSMGKPQSNSVHSSSSAHLELDEESAAIPVVAASSSKGFHCNVCFQNSVGSVTLSSQELFYQPDNGVGSKALAISWDKIAKHVASPPSSAKAMLKLTLKAGKPVIFELHSHGTLKLFNKDIGDCLQKYQKKKNQNPSEVAAAQEKSDNSRVSADKSKNEDNNKKQDAKAASPVSDIINKPVLFMGKSGSLSLKKDGLCFEPSKGI